MLFAVMPEPAELVEEQDAVLCQRHLARAQERRASPEECRR
jgi:hypothetical protein